MSERPISVKNKTSVKFQVRVFFYAFVLNQTGTNMNVGVFTPLQKVFRGTPKNT